MNNIQMIKTSDDNYRFISEFDKEGNLTFRSSRQIERIQTEKVVIEGEFVYTNLYFFHLSYLEKFLMERNAICR